MFKVNRLIHMQEGPAHVFSRANPWQTPGWPLPVRLDAMPYSELEMTRYNPWIGQTWQTARFWAKAGWPVRRYGWVDSTVTWDGAFRLNGQTWTPGEDDEYAEDWMIGGNAEVGGGDPGVDPFLIIDTEISVREVKVRCRVSKGDYPRVTISIEDHTISTDMGTWVTFSAVGKVVIKAVSEELIETKTVEIPLFPTPTSPYWMRGETEMRYNLTSSTGLVTHYHRRHCGTMENFSTAGNPPFRAGNPSIYPSGIEEMSDEMTQIIGGIKTPFGICSDYSIEQASKRERYMVAIALPNISKDIEFKSFTIHIEEDVFSYNVTVNSGYGDFSSNSVVLGQAASAYNIAEYDGVMFEKYEPGARLRWQLELHV